MTYKPTQFYRCVNDIITCVQEIKLDGITQCFNNYNQALQFTREEEQKHNKLSAHKDYQRILFHQAHKATKFIIFYSCQSLLTEINNLCIRTQLLSDNKTLDRKY